MSKTCRISSSDLETYVDSKEGAKARHPLSNWMSLQSQIYVEGITDLHKVSNQNLAPDIEQIRENNASKLLQDLEKVSKRDEANKYKIPEFKEEFYEELKKPSAERSKEYKDFIQACCDNFTPSAHMTEMVAARALQKLDDSNLSLNDLKESVEKNIEEYKTEYSAQAAKDQTRSAFLYKGQDGKTRHLTVEELMTSKEVSLSEEQRGFLRTSWQQGSFQEGWFGGIPNLARKLDVNDSRELWGYQPTDSTQVFIDASDDNVKVYNRLT